jgi:hypothetical protein
VFSPGQILLIVAIVLSPILGCRDEDEDEGERLCRKAAKMAEKDLRASLKLQRQIWQEMPTTGTLAAKKCLRPIREKMGQVRTLISDDKTGRQETIDGCAWAATVMEVFDGSPKAPFRKHWATRLMERCHNMLGRAWARDPDNPQYPKLSSRFKKLSSISGR